MQWQPLDTAPKDCYILGYDPHLKRPFVMIWNVPGGRFVATGGLGDETPMLWMPLPAGPSSSVFMGHEPASSHDLVEVLRKTEAILSQLQECPDQAREIIAQGYYGHALVRSRTVLAKFPG